MNTPVLNLVKNNIPLKALDFKGKKETAPKLREIEVCNVETSSKLTETLRAQALYRPNFNEGENIKAEILRAKKIIEDKKTGLCTLKEAYAVKKAEFDEAYESYLLIRREAQIRTSSVDDKEQDDIILELNKKDKEMRAKRSNVTKLKKEIERAEKYIKEKERYLSSLEHHPKTAFMYDPDLKPSEIRGLISKKRRIIPVYELARSLGQHADIISAFISSGVLEADTIGEKSGKNTTYYVDIDFPKNQDVINQIKEKNDTLISAFDFMKKYNVSEDNLRKYVKEGKINPFLRERENLGFNFLIDMSDDTNVQGLKSHTKLNPVPSEKYYVGMTQRQIPKLVPVQYLSKLGFGEPKELFRMVKSGVLKGEIKEKITPEGRKYIVQADVAPIESERILMIKRSENKNLFTIGNFAKRNGIKKERVIEALNQGELEIIPEYIYDLDHKTPILNLRNPKNAEFLEKLNFEREIEAKLQEKKRESKNSRQSVKMKIVWYMCPNTINTAKTLAGERPWLFPVFEKQETEGEDALDDKETRAVRSFYKDMWNISGVEEFSTATKKAEEILKIYEKSGIDTIEDTNIRGILEEKK